MPKLMIERSVVIEAPVELVYALVCDFQRWPEWSPWLSAEKDAALSFGDDGKSYAWDGAIVGRGEMRIQNAQVNESLQMQLSLLKPWKSQSAVSFRFSEENGGTRVVWRMEGSLPFFLFFMRPMMETLIGMDYERGLAMLKDLAELGAVPSTIELLPGQTRESCRYVGLVRTCSLAEMPDCMKTDFGRLQAFFEANQLSLSGGAFSIYSKWDLSKAEVEYSACFPVASKPDALPAEFVYREMPQVDAYVVEHTGAYRNLGNAWSAGMLRGRQKVFKQSKKVFPFEVYVTEIDSVPESEIVTRVYFPLA
ncbi:SRPBCC family protein [Coraliomargarita algicola]|uniref:SRPBCC family protein n=1 Tax=Coraliomargarita algicola TaxID=3092156 RepID=A0ABZ0RKB3_9BACT|nr:SRPBCC family protein [Coraliomargarita sp. J2-16]WPJ95709.1 SRPBCC family protein [Coraliomargarita sp. J2-16]